MVQKMTLAECALVVLKNKPLEDRKRMLAHLEEQQRIAMERAKDKKKPAK